MTSLYGRLPRTIGPQDAEQNIFGQLAWGMDHADYCLIRAPKPTLLCVATRDFFDSNDSWASYRVAKQAFGVLGRSEAMGLVEVSEEHGFTKPLREASVRWMLRWLKKRDEPIEEPADLEVLTAEEMRCLPQGEVMLIEGAGVFRTSYAPKRFVRQAVASASIKNRISKIVKRAFVCLPAFVE